MDDRDEAIELKRLERPGDRRARRLLRKALAVGGGGKPPGDLESRPAFRRQRTYPAEKGAAGALLDDEQAMAEHLPMADQERHFAPRFPLAQGLAPPGDEAHRLPFGKHRRIRLEILRPPAAQDEAGRLERRSGWRAEHGSAWHGDVA